jgi:hypothetical protein
MPLAGWAINDLTLTNDLQVSGRKPVMAAVKRAGTDTRLGNLGRPLGGGTQAKAQRLLDCCPVGSELGSVTQKKVFRSAESGSGGLLSLGRVGVWFASERLVGRKAVALAPHLRSREPRRGSDIDGAKRGRVLLG